MTSFLDLGYFYEYFFFVNYVILLICIKKKNHPEVKFVFLRSSNNYRGLFEKICCAKVEIIKTICWMILQRLST